MILFLSKGYFRSRNCLREIDAAMRTRKPVVLVWESEDPDKGGESVDELKAELDDERLEYVFGVSQADGRPIIPWQRSQPDQQKTLTMIAQWVLTTSPAYKGKQLELYLPEAEGGTKIVHERA